MREVIEDRFGALALLGSGQASAVGVLSVAPVSYRSVTVEDLSSAAGYQREDPIAEDHFLDAGHFALEERPGQVTSPILGRPSRRLRVLIKIRNRT